VIAPFDDYDVQTLLIESKLLVTDFSSVFFDFGYMGKPVIHYQFDREQYINEHYDYTKGYFDYDRDGFGEVATHGDRLVDLIIGYVASDFALRDQYKQRIDRFFPLCDNHNCDRIYAEIERVLN
jgi:CDP-glycerol glycerophosphotransferase (TagB/SpsB family)